MNTITGRVVNVLDESITPARITIADGRIRGIEPLPGLDAADVARLDYIIPGFVDAHLHIESTLMTPANYARAAVENGTVAAVVDPHEIANVLGRRGVEYMMRSAGRARMKISFAVPSCVPSTGFERAGAGINADETARMLATGQYVALAEMMNYPGVLCGDAEVLAKIEAARAAGVPIDGHAPALSGEEARRYVEAGISTDHELSDPAIARERLALGQKVLIREGSAARNFEALLPLLRDSRYRGRLMFCSDDLYPDEFREGYIGSMVRRAIRAGVSLWDALSAATVTPVRHYGLDAGLLLVGDRADFLVVDSLEELRVRATYIDGECVWDGLHDRVLRDDCPAEPSLNNFQARAIRPEDLRLDIPAGRSVRVIGAWDGELYTSSETATYPLPAHSDILKMAVLCRYTPDARPAVGFVRGFGLRSGAIASTVAHDSHNIIALGCTDADIAVAVNRLVETGGGLVAVDSGRVTAELPLPVAGLMSDRPYERLSSDFSRLVEEVHRLGCPMHAPFMTLAFMALPVIPELKLTDMGLFDVSRFCFTDLVTE